MSERAPHHVGKAARIRGNDGRLQTRSATLRVRIEPRLLEAAVARADELAPEYQRYNGRGNLSDYIRALILADLPHRTIRSSGSATTGTR